MPFARNVFLRASSLASFPPLLCLFFVSFCLSFLVTPRTREKREGKKAERKETEEEEKETNCEGRPRRRPRSGRGHRPRETVPEEPGHPGVAYSTPRSRRSQEKRIRIRGWLAPVSPFDVFQDAPEGEGPAQGCQRVQAA